MPELPEVETVRGQLAQVLVGQKIKSIKCLREKSLWGDPLMVKGLKIESVERKAKILKIKLKNRFNLLVHLKMTGQLVYVGRGKRVIGGHPSADWISKLPSKHTRVVIKLSRGILFFNDMRVFGWVKIVEDENLDKEFANYGPDVNSRQFTMKYFVKILSSSKRAVKLIILDQKKVAGLGNIYANDGLYLAKVNPEVAGVKLVKDKKAVERLFKSLKKVIRKGIKLGGASESDFKHVDGLGGSYQKHFLTYKKDGEKCKRCKREIKKIKLGGRGTYYCPKCQK